MGSSNEQYVNILKEQNEISSNALAMTSSKLPLVDSINTQSAGPLAEQTEILSNAYFITTLEKP